MRNNSKRRRRARNHRDEALTITLQDVMDCEERKRIAMSYMLTYDREHKEVRDILKEVKEIVWSVIGDKLYTG